MNTSTTYILWHIRGGCKQYSELHIEPRLVVIYITLANSQSEVCNVVGVVDGDVAVVAC